MPTPDAPVPDPTKATAPITDRAPAATSAPARPRGVPPNPDSDRADEQATLLPKSTSPWTIALGVVSVVLLIVVAVLWGKVGARDQALVGKENRVEQVEAHGVVLLAQASETKAGAERLQTQLTEAKAESDQFKADLEKLKAANTDLQTQLDKARAVSAGFQTQMEEAKVASIKRQGEVENAQAQTAVAQTQSNKAKADLVPLQAQLAEAKTMAADLQTRLGRAESEIAQLKKPPARK